MLVMAMGGQKQDYVLVLTPSPAMHCQSCESKIKNNMRFEKGVSQIVTSIEAQTVSITYDANKNTAEQLQKAMKKIGYDTRVVSNKPVMKKTEKSPAARKTPSSSN
ncbi:MAG: heavy-metal-associated domain-containing protein [Bacteroidales bacterium]|nr:heavy-metal-associated domain-containing protein [Bacteroidales bacterium]